VVTEPKKKPTLKTIAYMTGYAITTVSKALKDAPDIKDSTKKRVKMIAREIGYQPDRAGQRLRTGKTNVISMVLDNTEEITSMTNDFLNGITNALRGTQYNLVLTPYPDDPLPPVRNIADTRGADGIILSSIKAIDERVSYLVKAGLPFVTHGRSNMGIDHAYYDFDCHQLGQKAVQLLAKKGCKRASTILPAMQYTYAQHLQQGFMQGLDEENLTGQPLASVTGGDPIEKIAEQTAVALKQKNRPDGFVCVSINDAIAVIGGIEKAGLEVGKDVQIVSKQSSKNLLKWFGKSIYDIEDDFVEAGYQIASSLLNIINGESISDNQTVVFPELWGQNVIR